MANLAVEAARVRRREHQAQEFSSTEYFINEVSDKIHMTLEQRMRVAVEYLRTKVTKNISIPVERDMLGNVTQRSLPGEYPRMETRMLQKTIFGETVVKSKHSIQGYLGTPMWYAIPLELEMNRSFLLRTFNEELGRVKRILTGPIV